MASVKMTIFLLFALSSIFTTIDGKLKCQRLLSPPPGVKGGAGALSSPDLTEEEIQAIRDIWANYISINLEEKAVHFFLEIFKSYPNLLKLYPEYEHLSAQEMEENEDFRAHALKISNLAGGLIEVLDDSDKAIAFLTETIKTYVPPKATKRQFKKFLKVLHRLLAKAFKKEYTPLARKAFDKFINWTIKQLLSPPK